jgi:outer membrane protein OmpA-like peptidoglycan-associated protein
MKPGLLVPALCLLAVVACDHRPEDLGAVRVEQRRFHEGWSRQVGELEVRRRGLAERAQGVPADTGGLAEVLSQLAALEAETTRVHQAIAATSEEAGAQLTDRRLRLAREALGRGNRQLRTLVESIEAGLAEVAGRLESVEHQAARAAATPPPSSIADPAFAHHAATADLPLAFSRQTAALDLAEPGTRAALDQLVALAGRCDELRLALTAHTAGDGDPRINQRLSAARAEAVRAHLIAAGVTPDRIIEVRGAGASEPVVAEPAPGSPEEQAMSADELAALREQNRRVSVTVVTPCPAPGA